MKRNLLVSLLDQVMVLVFSAIGLLIFALILKIAGFKMVQEAIPSFLLIIYFICNVLYYPIMLGSKHNTTLGTKMMESKANKKELVVENNDENANDNTVSKVDESKEEV